MRGTCGSPHTPLLMGAPWQRPRGKGGFYSAASSPGAVSNLVPPFLQNLANSITGRQVSALRVLLGFLALILGFTITVVMLYVSIRSDMISIGRNPLAETALRRGLVDIIIAAIGVLLVTAVIVYAVLLS